MATSLTTPGSNYSLLGTSTGNAPATSVTPAAVQNKSLIAGSQAYKQFQGDALSADPATAGLDTNASKTLSAYLTANPESDQEAGILGRYNTAAGNVKTAATDTAAAIGKYYDTNLNDVQNTNNQEQTSAAEAQRGFATNTAALSNLQKTGDKRIRDLTNSRDAALLSNNADQAKALTDLITQEQTSITTARQNWVANLLSLSGENRAIATTQTPQQAAVIQFAQQYPGAGILPTDSIEEAGAKAASSPLYQANLSQIRASINAAQAGAVASYASAGLSGAQAAQTKTLTGLYTSPDTNGDVQALLSHAATPQQIQDKYAGYPNGTGPAIASRIISEAQSKGYNLNQGTLSGIAQETQTKAQNSGNPLTMFGSAIGNLFSGAGRSLTTPSAKTGGTTGVTPSGVSYTISP